MPTSKPTEPELDTLHLLWEMGPSTVRTVNDRLNDLREVDYTTTLKLLQIMHEKGLVNRIEDGRTHIYTASVTQDATTSGILKSELIKDGLIDKNNYAFTLSYKKMTINGERQSDAVLQTTWDLGLRASDFSPPSTPPTVCPAPNPVA